MHRRQFLATAGATGGLLTAGCLGDDGTTALSAPDRAADPDVLPYPTHGDRLPEMTIPTAAGESISTVAYVGQRETLLTCIFTRCPGPCHSLTASLAHVQADGAERGYGDEIALFTATFDPEHDTPERLRSFAAENGADPDADNFVLLRPESPAEAESAIGETFGVAFEEVPLEEADHDDHATDADGDDGHTGHDHDPDGTDETDHGSGDTTFVHANLLVLANRDGYVERAYDRQPPRPDEVIDDLEAVRESFA